MASPYAQQQILQSGGVSFMPRPVGPRGPVTRQVAPTRRTNAGNRQQGSIGILGALAANAANTPTVLKRQQEQAEQEAYDAQPMWKKGLGMVVGNPVVGTALKGVDYLSYPRKALQLALSEAVTALPDNGLGNFAEAMISGGLGTLIDEERVDADKRSNWEKLTDPDYGFGQMLDQDNNSWVNRVAGLAGDVVMDPTTYITGPTMKVIEGAETASKGARALTALDKLNDATRLGDEALEAGLGAFGRIDDVAELGKAYELANADYIAARAQPGGTRAVTVHANRAGRLNELYNLGARQTPEWMARNMPELERIAQRGFGAATTPEVREAFGLLDPQLRFMGMGIKGTKAPAALVQRGGGVIRGGLNRSGLGTKLARGGMGLEGVVEDLVGRGSGRGDTYRALATGYGAGLAREGREVEARVNRILADFRGTDLKGKSPDQIQEIVTAAETAGEMTPLNDVFDQISRVYEDVSGRSIQHHLRDKTSYFPHMFTPDAREFMTGHEKGAESARTAMGFVVDDLMEGSRFLEKSRKFAPDVVGEPKTFEINGRKITLRTGTVEEANEQLSKAFPELGPDFKWFETNPETVIEAYGSSLAKGAGRDIAARKLEESQYPFVKKLGGEILGEKEQFERLLAARHAPERTVLGGYSPRVAQDVVAGTTKAARAVAATPVPNSAHFMATKGDEATAEMTAALKSPKAKAFVAQAKETTKQGVNDLIEMVRTERQPLLDELTEQAEGFATAAEAAAKRKVATRKLGDSAKRIHRVLTDKKNLLEADQKDLTRWVSDMRVDIAELKERLARENRNVGRRLKKAEKETREVLRGQIETYENLATRLENEIDTRFLPLDREAKVRRAHLNAEVDRARTDMGVVERNWENYTASPEELDAAYKAAEGTGYGNLLPRAQQQEKIELTRELNRLTNFVDTAVNVTPADKVEAQKVLDNLAAYNAEKAAAAPPPPAAKLSWTRDKAGGYTAPGGWTIKKNGKSGWIVTAPDGAQEVVRTLDQARTIADQYAQLPPEALPAPVVPPAAVPEPAAVVPEPAPVAPEAAPTAAPAAGKQVRWAEQTWDVVAETDEFYAVRNPTDKGIQRIPKGPQVTEVGAEAAVPTAPTPRSRKELGAWQKGNADRHHLGDDERFVVAQTDQGRGHYRVEDHATGKDVFRGNLTDSKRYVENELMKGEPPPVAAAPTPAAAAPTPPALTTFESIGDNVFAADTPAGRYRIEGVDFGDGELSWMVEYPDGNFIDEPLGTLQQAEAHVQAQVDAAAKTPPVAAAEAAAAAAPPPAAAAPPTGPSMAGAVEAAPPPTPAAPRGPLTVRPSGEEVVRAREILAAENTPVGKVRTAKGRVNKINKRLAELEEMQAAAPPMNAARARRIVKAHKDWLAAKEEALKGPRRRLERAEREQAWTQAAIVENQHGERQWHPAIGAEGELVGERRVQPLPYGEQPPAAAYAEEPVEGAVPFESIRGRVNEARPQSYPARKPPSEDEAILELRRAAVEEWKETARRAQLARERKVDLIERSPEIMAKGQEPVINQYVENVVGSPTEMTVAGRREGGYGGLESQIATKEKTISQTVERRSGVIRDAQQEVTTLTRDSQEAAQKLINTKDANAVAKAEATDLRGQARKVEAQIKAGSHPGKKLNDISEVERQMIEPIEKLIGSPEHGIPAQVDVSDPAMAHTVALLDEAAKMSLDTRIANLSGKQAQKMIDAASKGTLAPVMIATLNDNWKLLYDGIPKTGDVIMDKQLAKRFENLFVLDKQPQMFGRTFNALTNWFKTYATLSPGFQVRNSLGGIFMNTSDGVALKHQYDAVGLWRGFMEGGEGFLMEQPQEIRDAFRATFSSGAGGRYTEAGVVGGRPPFKFGSRAYQKSMNNPATRLGQRAGARVEGVLRLGMALDSVYNGQTVQEALTRINRVHFDYADVSKLDKTMKSFVPFWTFMSRNLPLQISQTWTKPRTYQIYESFVRNFSSADEANTPEYWQEQGGWNTGLNLGGLPMYAMPDLGYQQMQGQVETLETALSGENPLKLLSMGNPLMTAPAEYVSRQDFFTGQQFPKDEGFTEATGPLAGLYTALATVTGNTNEAGQIDPRFSNALRAVNPVLDRTMRLAPQVLAAESGQGTGSRQLESWLRFAGMPIRTLTPEQQRSAAYAAYYDKLDEAKRRQAMAVAG